MNAQYKKNLKDVATACKNYTDKKIDDLKWELGSHTLDVESDTTTAYTKTIPSGAIKCHINKIGGNLVSENKFGVADTIYQNYGVTISIQNGVISVSGTANSSQWVMFPLLETLTNNTYTFSFSNNSIYTSFGFSRVSAMGGSETEWFQFNSNPYTRNINQINYFGVAIFNGTTYSDYSTTIMCNIGSTPLPYEPEGIKNSPVTITSVVSKDSNNDTLDTFTIPAEVQALEGYGQSNPNDSTEYNYIDFENKLFKRKGYIDNGEWVTSVLDTDISSYIDNNSIVVEPNGTLTFNNTYNQEVPSDIDYLIEEVKA